MALILLNPHQVGPAARPDGLATGARRCRPFWARLADTSSPQSPDASPELADIVGGHVSPRKSANLDQIGRPTFETFEKMAWQVAVGLAGTVGEGKENKHDRENI